MKRSVHKVPSLEPRPDGQQTNIVEEEDHKEGYSPEANAGFRTRERGRNQGNANNMPRRRSQQGKLSDGSYGR